MRENEARLREEREEVRRAREEERDQSNIIDKANQEEVIFPVQSGERSPRDPALLDAVIEALPRESVASRYSVK